MSATNYQRYRFGPLERRGLIGSLRPTQVVVLAASLGGSVILLRTLSSGGGVVAALALSLTAVGFCFWPIGGRSAEAWLPIVGRHAARVALGTGMRRSPAPQAGTRLAADGRPEAVAALPEAGRELELLAVPLRGETVGVLKDRRARSYTAVLAVRVASFGLLDRSEQEARQAGWGGVLAGLAREGSPVSRIQWLERTVPADGDEVGRYLGEAWARDTVPVDSLAMQSYLELTSSAPAVTRDHEIFVCLQIDAKRAWRQIKRSGGKQGADAGACAVLLRELETLAERLAAADVRVVGALRPGILATAVRVAFDPWSRPGLARLAAADPDRDGIDEAAAWPLGTETSWAVYRTDGAFHVTYWIASWPRIDVGAAFLSPLLLHAQVVRAIAVTIEPISPLKAMREVEAARTSDVADRELRGRMGFIETARRRRQTEAVARREEELADGHAAVRFAGYVTVSARTLEELERHCSELEHAAQMARLELLRMYGQQEEAFTYTLPLCRGLR
ncbi:MAG TPA: SCO6880 family protein [Gaiellaceae bacterium]|nr:SCO6880 family protein [Gaiellaceae bacterium]